MNDTTNIITYTTASDRKKFIKGLTKGDRTEGIDAYAFFIDDLLSGKVSLDEKSEWKVELLDNGSDRIEISYPNIKGRRVCIKVHSDPLYTSVFCAVNIQNLQNPYVCNLDGDLFPTDKKYVRDEDIEEIEDDKLVRFLCKVANIDYDNHINRLNSVKESVRKDNVNPVENNKMEILEKENTDLKNQLSKIEGMLLMLNQNKEDNQKQGVQLSKTKKTTK